MGCVTDTTEDGGMEEEGAVLAHLDPWVCHPWGWDRWGWGSHRSLGDRVMIVVSRAVILMTGGSQGGYLLVGHFFRPRVFFPALCSFHGAH